MRDVEELEEVLGTLDACYNWPKMYITEVLDPIVYFRKYKVFGHTVILAFYSLLWSAMMEARGVNLLRKLIEQTLLSIMSQLPPGDWKLWARERPSWIQEDIKEACGEVCGSEMEGLYRQKRKNRLYSSPTVTK